MMFPYNKEEPRGVAENSHTTPLKSPLVQGGTVVFIGRGAAKGGMRVVAITGSALHPHLGQVPSHKSWFSLISPERAPSEGYIPTLLPVEAHLLL